MSRRIVTALAVIAMCIVLAASAVGTGSADSTGATPAEAAKLPPLRIVPTADGIGRVTLSEAEWKRRLTAEQFWVLRHQGTEIAFTGAYWNHHEKGTYLCAACGLSLFSSRHKYESGTGWPSFWQAIAPGHVRTADGNAHAGMMGDELSCARCGGHLGHVFPDGPEPTGLRYCIDSVSLRFQPAR
jgi:peptide-methionine (R)-S-oxide reductase